MRGRRAERGGVYESEEEEDESEEKSGFISGGQMMYFMIADEGGRRLRCADALMRSWLAGEGSRAYR